MPKFTREYHTVDGVKTAVYSAGHGEPLVFFHGAGTAAESAGKFDTSSPTT